MKIKMTVLALAVLAVASLAWAEDFNIKPVNDIVGRITLTSTTNSTNATLGHNGTAGNPLWMYSSFKVKAIPNGVTNSSGDITSYALPAGGAITIYDLSYTGQHPAANQTAMAQNGSLARINLSDPHPIFIGGPFNGLAFEPSGIAQNRTFSIEVTGIKTR